MSVVWVLNFDADLELAEGKSYSPSDAVLNAMKRGRGLFAMGVFGRGDCLDDEPGAAQCEVGRAFCPTPRAIAVLRKLEVEPEPHPDSAILRRVNGRQFCTELGDTLPGGRFVTTVPDAVELISMTPPIGRQWRAKRAFGMAGRGQRPIAAGAVSAADADYLAASISSQGGIQLEPEVDIEREVSMHAMLDPTGNVRVGRVVALRSSPTGQYMGSTPTTEELPALTAEMHRVAEALHAAGYFGPFNVDAYFYRDDGDLRFQPRSEINARYSMGFGASGLVPRR